MEPAKVLAVRQPHAWLIANAWKDVENRSWRTNYRGLLLIQASAALPSRYELDQIRRYAYKRGVELPGLDELLTGGLVGSCQLVDCVDRHRSPWYEPGSVAWVLSRAQPLPFVALKGRLGLFDPPAALRRRLKL